jgi:hypothetical protein
LLRHPIVHPDVVPAESVVLAFIAEDERGSAIGDRRSAVLEENR